MSCKPFVLYINQGADLLYTVSRVLQDGTPVDLTGATFVGQIRSSAGSSVIIQALTVAIFGDPLNGQYRITLTATQTAALPVDPNVNFQNDPTLWTFDILMTQGGVKTRILQGTVSVSPQVSV